ncbi:hypothetical protein [Metallosphaera javensis (ex Hofmann et al. 2022)]|uniref:hypothetical protein n=1 Tax=Metallosphaera javensis (ex Hofmann et al. 2022) TaxID=99938 RepID=UPI003D160415
MWRKFNFKLVVADMVRSVDLLELSGIDAKRQLCLNHVKRRLDRDERKEVDLLLSGLLQFPNRIKELVERGLLSFTSLPQELQRLLSTTWWSPSTPWWRGGGSASTTRPTDSRSSGPSPITTTFWIIFCRNGIISIYFSFSLRSRRHHSINPTLNNEK